MENTNIEQIFEKIMNLKEAEEFKKVIRKWKLLSENIKDRPMNAPVLLPDMLWVAKSGVGKTNLLKLASEYLYQCGNLMDFYGDVKFFEFLLSYCEPSAPFTELNRLMDEVKNAAGFRSEFRGIVRIDIDEWLDHFEEKHFITFMEYLSANSENWMIILSVAGGETRKLHNLEAFLSMYLRMEKVTLSLPKTNDLFEHIEGKLASYSLSLEEDAKKLLYDTIETMRKNKYFDGFKSINMLCQDIVYKIFSQGKVKKYSLDANALSDFSCDSEYVKRTVANIEKVGKIGLVARGE